MCNLSYEGVIIISKAFLCTYERERERHMFAVFGICLFICCRDLNGKRFLDVCPTLCGSLSHEAAEKTAMRLQ